MKLHHKSVLITGASSGLGREIALSIAPNANQLVLTARRADRLEEVAQMVRDAGSECLVVPCDATDPAATQAVIDAAITTFGRIDVAVLNAGGGDATSMAAATVSEVIGTMRKNYDTFVNFLCPLIDHMKPTGGTIAYTGSPAGYFGLPKSGPYSASKAAGRVLFDSCRIELADSGIRFVALYPGFTYTDGLNPEDVPVKALIIRRERAAKEMVRAIERGTSHAMFPKRIKLLISFARLLPEPFRRRLLTMAA